MTTFSSTASPGQRWKLFLPGAASAQCDALSVSTAAAFFRSQWLSNNTTNYHHKQSLALGAPLGGSRGHQRCVQIGPRAFGV
jgi:hypothetical protein